MTANTLQQAVHLNFWEDVTSQSVSLCSASARNGGSMMEHSALLTVGTAFLVHQIWTLDQSLEVAVLE